MPDVRLDGFLGEEESLSDLAIDQAVRDELEDLDLARGRLLLELLQRAREGNDLRATAASQSRSSRRRRARSRSSS